MRILAVDYGTVRTGIAISDPTGTIASPLCVFPSGNIEKLCLSISEKVKEYSVEKIVLGNPVRTDGKPNEMKDKILLFAGLLQEKTGITPILSDERYTTKIAGQYLHDSGKRAREQRKTIDAAAAAVLLQEYLNSNK